MTFVKQNILYILSYMDIFAVSLIVPLFNQHLQSLGFSNVKIGFLSSIYSAVQFVSSPIVGHLSDVHGTKRALIVTMIVCAVCYPIMGLVQSFVSVIAIRTAIGFAKHTQLLCKNCVEEMADKETQTNSFGKLNGFTSMGYIVGPIIGGYIIEVRNGFTYMCCMTGVCFLVNAFLAYLLPPPSTQQRQRNPSKPVVNRNFIASFRNIPWTVCWDLFALKCLTVLGVFSFYMNYSQAISARFGTSTVLVGYSLSVQGLVRGGTAFLIKYVVMLFPKRLGVMAKLQVCYAIVILSFVVIFFCSNFYTFLLVLVPLNVCLCFIRISNHEALVNRVTDYNKGIILGAYNNVTAICRFVLPLISGALVDLFGYNSVYVVPMFSLLIGILTISYSENARKKIE